VDLVLPDRSGAVLTRALRRRRPDLALVYMSGYGDPDGDDREPGLFLAKPFTAEQLTDAIRAALAQTRAPREAAEPPRADLA
jgi:FixJ family two-component response regulator